MQTSASLSCPCLLCRLPQRKRQRTLATDSAGEEDVDVKAEPASSGLQPLVSPMSLPSSAMADGKDYSKHTPSTCQQTLQAHLFSNMNVLFGINRERLMVRIRESWRLLSRMWLNLGQHLNEHSCGAVCRPKMSCRQRWKTRMWQRSGATAFRCAA